MKTTTVTETVEVESYEVVTTYFGCEQCTFVTEDRELYDKHYGQTHASKGEQKIGEITFRLFETEGDLKAYSVAWVGQGGDRTDVCRWAGPGWYGFEGKMRPCSRSCCSDWVTEVLPLQYHEDKWLNQWRELKSKIKELRKLK